MAQFTLTEESFLDSDPTSWFHIICKDLYLLLPNVKIVVTVGSWPDLMTNIEGVYTCGEQEFVAIVNIFDISAGHTSPIHDVHMYAYDLALQIARGLSEKMFLDVDYIFQLISELDTN